MAEPTRTRDLDPLTASLTAGAQDAPESRVLDALVGRWRVTTEWEPAVGKGIRRSEGRVENRWILDGRVLESDSYDEQGTLTTKLLLAFDPIVRDYAGYCVNVLSSFFVLERGTYDPGTATLALDAHEPKRNRSGETVHYRRSIGIGAPPGYTMAISYPGVPEGTYGPMRLRHERIR